MTTPPSFCDGFGDTPPVLPCPTCDRPLPSGTVCDCGFDDRPATEMERAWLAHVMGEESGE